MVPAIIVDVLSAAIFTIWFPYVLNISSLLLIAKPNGCDVPLYGCDVPLYGILWDIIGGLSTLIVCTVTVEGTLLVVGIILWVTILKLYWAIELSVPVINPVNGL